MTHGGPEAFTVMAAGRALVAAPRAFSNPFTRWEPRDAQRRRVVEAVTGEGPAVVPCADVEAGLWALLRADSEIVPDRARTVFRSDAHAVHRVLPGACRETR
ncbi:hypothetical protein [Paracraurococcus lichenis]|uniref:Uncharacterized protein n=1 Tax=Paracraurococcus lichenis TaxID=3064888 RepID=A0ABT9E1D4_9PROT|nr:hypothetical protein [Paracraurococcus sp. LOR1-02]MDO9709939.1 hypothetical protein [Paracraurococcus sp. LOR1-02]